MRRENGPESISVTNIYLNQIGRYPLLTAKEEVSLAKRIETGVQATEEFLDLIREGEVIDKSDSDEAPVLQLVRAYERIKSQETKQAGSAKRYPVGSSRLSLDAVVERLKSGSLEAVNEDAELQLCHLKGPIIRGARARETFIESNLRLVVSIAKKYLGTGIPLPDLIQEGSVGLSHAVDKFEYRQGFKFSTYATWWIRQSVARGVDNQLGIIRIPAHLNDKSKALQKLEIESPNSSDQDLANTLGIDVKDIAKIRNARITANTDSIDRELDEEGSLRLGDIIADTVDVEQEAVRASVKVEISSLLDNLTDQEALVIRERYGLESGVERTLQDIGVQFGLTRERIRQIERRAIDKLQSKGIDIFLWPELAEQTAEKVGEKDERQKQARNERNQRNRYRARELGKIPTAATKNN